MSVEGHSRRYCHVRCLVGDPRYRTGRTPLGSRLGVGIWRRAGASEGRSRLVGRITIRHDESAISRVTPEPVIGPRLARTRWAATRPGLCVETSKSFLLDQAGSFWCGKVTEAIRRPRNGWIARLIFVRSVSLGETVIACPRVARRMPKRQAIGMKNGLSKRGRNKPGAIDRPPRRCSGRCFSRIEWGAARSRSAMPPMATEFSVAAEFRDVPTHNYRKSRLGISIWLRWTRRLIGGPPGARTTIVISAVW
jgi:hypothetical protein